MLKPAGLGARGSNLSPSLFPGQTEWGRRMEAAMDVKYKPILFPNGAAVKKAAKPAAVAPAGEPQYRECLKNHAASLGGHAVDGCGEFMPSPGANPADPTSLKCAACGCHRNFHRRTLEGSPPPPAPAPAPLALPPPPVPPSVLHGHPHRGGEETPEDRHPPGVVDADDSDSDSDGSEYDEERSVSPPPHPHHVPAPIAQQPPPPPYFASAPHMLLSLGSGGAPGAAAAPQRLAPAQLTPSSAPPPGGAMPRKRFRTKFTAEQKQRMQELSERLGWRLQKRDEAVVEEWCRDMGVGKGVFKVWMHNNKHNFLGGHSARRSAAAASATALHSPTANAGAAAPPFNNPSGIIPPPPVLTSSPPAADTGFNINGAASSAPTVSAGHSDNANGASSPQSA